MKSSQNVFIIIKHYEGKSNKAYICPSGVPTIGYGHTHNVKLGDTATDNQINEWLYQDVMVAEMHVNDLRLKLNQNQFDACVDFVFNLGVGWFKLSTMLKLIKQNNYDKNIPLQFMRWTKALAKKDGIDNDHDGIIDEVGELEELDGLINRRKTESELYALGVLNLYTDKQKKI